MSSGWSRPDKIKHPLLHQAALLRRWYDVEQLSLSEIGRLIGCGTPSVWKAFRKLCIPTRRAHPQNTARAAAKFAASNRLKSQGRSNGRWRGGRFIDSRGYVRVKEIGASAYAFEHRLVMARTLGRPLLDSEVVHHINRNKSDNRPENLRLCSSHSEHALLHYAEGDGCGRSL